MINPKDVDAEIYAICEKIPYPIQLTLEQIYQGVRSRVGQKYPKAKDNEVRELIRISPVLPSYLKP